MLNKQINNIQCLRVLKEQEGKALEKTVVTEELTSVCVHVFICVSMHVCTHMYVCMCMLLEGDGVQETNISK